MLRLACCTLREVSQLSRQLLGFGYRELLSSTVPSVVKQQQNFVHVVAWNADCKLACIDNQTKHCLDWPNNKFFPFIHSQRALPNCCVWFTHYNEDCLDQGGQFHHNLPLGMSKEERISHVYCAGRFFLVPSAATMPVLKLQATAGVIGVLGSSSTQPIMSKYFPYLLTRLGWLAYTSDSVSIACRRGSQLNADIVVS